MEIQGFSSYRNSDGAPASGDGRKWRTEKRMIKTITAAELINGRTFDRTIIDIRPAEEYKKGSMDAALNIPEDKLVEYLENPEEADMESGTIGEGKAWEEGVNVGKLLAAIPKDKPVWVLCHSGNKSLYVAELLDDAGFDAGSVEGGYRSFLRLSLSMMVMNEEEVAERTKAIERSIITKYRKSIWRRFTKGVHDYELIKEGDKIAVCISGGKDSMLMAKLLQELKLHGKVKFDLVFLVMNPGYNEVNYQTILNNAKMLNIPITVFRTEIFDTVVDITDSPCYLCARMRRGYLYSKARELGCNKIALGHHFDDVIETIVMGMLYGAQIQTMMPKLHSTNFEGMELIRPLYLVREADIIHWAQYNDLHFIQCACRFTEGCASCGGTEKGSKRADVKRLIHSLEQENPYVAKNIFRSVENVNLNTVIGYKKDGVRHHFLDTYDDAANPNKE